MDLYESLNKVKNNNNKKEYDKYLKLAYDYSSQGFPKVKIAELLQIEGCERNVSHELAVDAVKNLPSSYELKNKPQSYFDVKSKVENTILRGDMDTLESYFEYSKKENRFSEGVLDRIKLARSTQRKSLIDEVHEELKPYIEGVIMSYNVLAEKEQPKYPNDEQKIEYELFGVWSPYHMKGHSMKNSGEEKFLSALNKREQKNNEKKRE